MTRDFGNGSSRSRHSYWLFCKNVCTLPCSCTQKPDSVVDNLAAKASIPALPTSAYNGNFLLATPARHAQSQPVWVTGNVRQGALVWDCIVSFIVSFLDPVHRCVTLYAIIWQQILITDVILWECIYGVTCDSRRRSVIGREMSTPPTSALMRRYKESL